MRKMILFLIGLFVVTACDFATENPEQRPPIERDIYTQSGDLIKPKTAKDFYALASNILAQAAKITVDGYCLPAAYKRLEKSITVYNTGAKEFEEIYGHFIAGLPEQYDIAGLTSYTCVITY